MLGRRGRHAAARLAWHRLCRPVSCREMAAAVCRHAPSADAALARMLLLGRWRRSTIVAALRDCGIREDTVLARVRAGLREAPERRREYRLLRSYGVGAEEAMRELGL